MALNEIKKHILTTQKTAKITNAMQMVSHNKVNHMLDMAQTYQVYIDHLRRTIMQLHYTLKVTPPNFTQADIQQLIRARNVNKVGIFLISIDKGLAGPYNANLFNGLDEWIKEQGYTHNDLCFYTLGKSGKKYCKERDYEIARSYYPLSDEPSYEEAHYFIRQLRQAFISGEIDELYLAFHHYGSGSAYHFGVEKLLPILSLNSNLPLDDGLKNEDPITKVYLIEPSIEAVLEGLIPQYIESNIYGALIQAKTAEHFARMTAMKIATDNANEMIANLQLQYNQERQVKVTNEIIEIVAGAQAQQKERRK
ncbi:ATP synthase F1 subunit gamma [Facklamia sp. DSM 111018]|uniref:ATP synthase gamma chain n=1 Tax=Facklamia lactis TaxID=2749967 RepID=A0ABS0LPG4_9LACT|nr:ATP synthase F1 subunit gamma [Facklamia lactis]MBG9979925.1 ATP synthase F1 subunit gamma [Facklamia lactis]MBG9985395.1 ATP synthase F1 subunit gamma [Facklamia lactis]